MCCLPVQGGWPAAAPASGGESLWALRALVGDLQTAPCCQSGASSPSSVCVPPLQKPGGQRAPFLRSWSSHLEWCGRTGGACFGRHCSGRILGFLAGRRGKVLCSVGGSGQSCAFPEPADPLTQWVPELAGHTPWRLAPSRLLAPPSPWRSYACSSRLASSPCDCAVLLFALVTELVLL